ncbi:MAG TPA: peptide deformylase [Negativicutes bacterium]|nr:peptide deformylase [Negativicutes bacterium]
MAVLNICLEGEKVLKMKAKPVSKVTKEIKKLLEDMAETMYEAQGVGLAAPQVGLSLRVVVIDAGSGLIELINPVIIEQEGEETDTEGCLSIPDAYGEVCRSARVMAEAYDRNGKKIRVTGEGLLARAIQHELDHLEGVLFIEKAEKLSRGEGSNA